MVGGALRQSPGDQCHHLSHWLPPEPWQTGALTASSAGAKPRPPRHNCCGAARAIGSCRCARACLHGSYLSAMYPSTKGRRAGAAEAITVRVIEYSLPDLPEAQPATGC